MSKSKFLVRFDEPLVSEYKGYALYKSLVISLGIVLSETSVPTEDLSRDERSTFIEEFLHVDKRFDEQCKLEGCNCGCGRSKD